jgi:hypothetical protein
VAAQNLIQTHAEEIRAYRLANNVNKTCCKAILDAFDYKFIAARADPIVRYANEMAILLITHLKEFYAFISPIELVANYERMCQTYDPSRPMEDLFKQIQDGRAYAQAGQQPYGTHKNKHFICTHIQHQRVRRCMQRVGETTHFRQKLGILQSALYH